MTPLAQQHRIERGTTRVRVKPAILDPNDVLELAEAILERDGWIKHNSGNATQGWSLHGAIGEAARLLGEADRAGYGGGKDGPVARPLRDGATALLDKVLPDGETEYTFNDKADTVQAVIDVMRAARGAS